MMHHSPAGLQSRQGVPPRIHDIAPVTVPLGFLQTFYWTGSAWSDNAISSQTSSSTNTVSPPTNLHIMN